MRIFNWQRTGILLACAFVAACGGNGGSTSASTPSPTSPSPAPTPAPANPSLSVLVNPTVLGVGETARGSATLRGTGDVTGQTTWQSLNPSIAMVSANGVVTGLTSGTALIQATYNGGSATFPLEVISGVDIVDMYIAHGTMTMSQPWSCAPRLVLVPGNVIYDLDPPTRATYASSNQAVAIIAADGTVTSVSPGNTTITVTYLGKSVSAQILVVPPGNDRIDIVSSTLTGDLVVGGSVTLSMNMTAVLRSTPGGEVTIRIWDTQFPSHLVGSFPSVPVSGSGPQPATVQGTFTIPPGLPSICPMGVLTMSSGKAIAAYDVCRGVH